MDKTSPTYTIETTKHGDYTLSTVDESGSRVYLHSRYNPAREAAVAARDIHPDKYDILVVLGTGLGHHLETVARSIGIYSMVILVEKLPAADDMRKHFAFPGLLENPASRLVCGETPEKVMHLLSGLLDLDSARGFQVYEHPASLRAFPSYYGRIRGLLRQHVAQQSSSLVTRASLGWKYLKNGLHNLNTIPGLFPVRETVSAFSGSSAVILIPGPSLDLYINQLRSIHESIFIIAVDSALQVCRAHGIVPDFCVSIDPQSQVNAHTFTWHNDHTWHICSITAHPETMRFPSTFLSLNTHPLAQAVDELYPGLTGSVDSKTGTVAGDAVRFAALAGFSPILVTGLDSSFPGFSVYASDSQYQHTYRTRCNRISTVQTMNMNYIMKSSGGLREKGLYTRRSFLQYRDTISSLMSEVPGTIYHASGKGLPLPGVLDMRVEDFLHERVHLSLNKKAMMENIISDISPLQKYISLDHIKEVLGNREIRARIIEASLHHPDERLLQKATEYYIRLTG